MLAVECNLVDIVWEPAHFVHLAGAQQLAQQVDQARPADTLGRAAANHPEAEPAIAFRGHVFNRAVQGRHPASDRAPFEGRTGRTGSGHNPVAVAHDQFGIRPDVHDRDQPVFMGQVHRQHARRRIRAHVAADHRAPHTRACGWIGSRHRRPGSSGWWWCASRRPFRFR